MIASGSGPATPDGRLIDTLLASYAAGALSEPLAVLVAAHLQIKSENRLYVEDLEAAGGMLLDGIEPVPLPDRDRRLASMLSRPRLPAERAAPAAKPSDDVLPPVLRAYVGSGLERCRWRMALPGISQCRIAINSTVRAYFLRCRAGKALPVHTHDGLETALVLAGGFRDESGQFARGDIAVADDTVEHRPIADRGGDCLIFLVVEGAVRFTGRLSRVLRRFTGEGRRQRE